MNAVIVSKLGEMGWHPPTADGLKHSMEVLFKHAPRVLSKPIKALVLPHAGYTYSGLTAAMGITQIDSKTRYSKILILGPSHYVPLKNKGHITSARAIQTPLGEAPLDTESLAFLKKAPIFESIDAIDQQEHCIQIEVPFFQTVLPGIPILPIVLGSLDRAAAHGIAELLEPFLDDTTLLVISSDFTHYGASFGYVPFSHNIEENIRSFDAEVIAPLCDLNESKVYNEFRRRERTICGESALKVMVPLLRSKWPSLEGTCIDYRMSGQLNSDWSFSVSYAALTWT